MSDSSANWWTVVRQVSLSVRFLRQEYWSGCHFLLQEIFLTQGLNLLLLWFLDCRWSLYCWTTREAPILNESFPEFLQAGDKEAAVQGHRFPFCIQPVCSVNDQKLYKRHNHNPRIAYYWILLKILTSCPHTHKIEPHGSIARVLRHKHSCCSLKSHSSWEGDFHNSASSFLFWLVGVSNGYQSCSSVINYSRSSDIIILAWCNLFD